MRQTINGADFRRLVISAAAAIEINKQKLNDLNVFPVPDGDTGTNMSMTINAAAADLRKLEDPSLEKAASAAASAMLRGARGNSGVILSLLFRGISRRLKGLTECDGTTWAEALQEGVDAAYKAVMKPAEGTILTVARLAAAKATQAAQENTQQTCSQLTLSLTGGSHSQTDTAIGTSSSTGNGGLATVMAVVSTSALCAATLHTDSSIGIHCVTTVLTIHNNILLFFVAGKIFSDGKVAT